MWGWNKFKIWSVTTPVDPVSVVRAYEESLARETRIVEQYLISKERPILDSISSNLVLVLNYGYLN